MALNQEAWQALTSWDGEAPTLRDAWELLTSAELSEGFTGEVNTLEHETLRAMRRAAEGTLLAGAGAEPRPQRRREWNVRFANLMSGRFTELVFQRAYRQRLDALGLDLDDATGLHDWTDYLLRQAAENFTLGINVKNAGVQFRQSAERVGLVPADTLPIATYKIFGSTAKAGHVPLVYVYLVDWELLTKLRTAYWNALNEEEQQTFRLMTSFRGIPQRLEDRFIACTVEERIDALLAGVGYDGADLANLPFRVISGRRCQRIFYLAHERAPYVYVQKMNTDPNVHVSVAGDTVHFVDFTERWLSTSELRTELLAGLSRTEMLPIPDPPI